MKEIACIGRAMTRDVCSGYSRAIDFGISSPITTCRKVISANEIDTDTVCVAIFWLIPGRNTKIGSIILASVPSPTHPKPILDIVTPS